MSESEGLRIIFAGGGTAGHLMPAINIATEMAKINRTLIPLFVGKRGGIEKEIVGRHGYDIEEIDVIGMKRTPMGILKFILRWNVSNKQALKIVRDFDPLAVVGTGGYVSAPVIRAAHKLKKMIFLQEQNSLPGMAIRSVARYADIIFIAYKSALKYFQERKCLDTGNPIRTDLADKDRDKSLQKFGLSSNKKTLLVLGGSSGASSINEAVMEIVRDCLPENWQLLWQTGNRDFNYYEKVADDIRGIMFPFIDDMPSAYAAADLVLSRAGAMAISELTATGLPSILIPYTHATGDHQSLNARVLENAKAAVVVSENEIKTRLREVLERLFNSDIDRENMGSSARAMAKPNAASIIARTILEKINEV